MNNLEQHLQTKRIQKQKFESAWLAFEALHQETPFDNRIFRSVQARFSSKLAQIDRSIVDHEKLLEGHGKTV